MQSQKSNAIIEKRYFFYLINDKNYKSLRNI